MSEIPETMPATPTTGESAVVEYAPVILHREYTVWSTPNFDACLWRFFRAAGYRATLDTDDALTHEATHQVIARGATHGEVSYSISFLWDPEVGEEQRYRIVGSFVLLPQLNNTTQLQVIRYGASTPELDVAMVGLWQEARAWLLDQANGQPAARRVAQPRRVSTS